MNSSKYIKLPLTFFIFGFINLFFPLIIILTLKYTSGLSFDEILMRVASTNNLLSKIDFWFIFPIAGIAIFIGNKYSYPIIILVNLYSIFSFLIYEKINWGFLSSKLTFSPILLLVFNVIMLFYFLLPEVVKLFYYPGERWWNTKTRYITNIPCSINLQDNNTISECTIRNISLTGAFISGPLPNISYINNVHLIFKFEQYELNILSDLVSQHSTNETTGYGINFKPQKIIEKYKLWKVLKKISKNTDQKQRWEL